MITAPWCLDVEFGVCGEFPRDRFRIVNDEFA